MSAYVGFASAALFAVAGLIYLRMHKEEAARYAFFYSAAFVVFAVMNV